MSRWTWLAVVASAWGYTPRHLRAPQATEMTSKWAKAWVDAQGVHTPLSEHIARSNEVQIFSYNVLGPLHGEGSKHDYAPVHVTKWTRRREKLCDELRSLGADVLCLQEVSQKALRETFIPGLRQVGLVCSGFAPSKAGAESKGRFGHKNIGCAIFTRPARIRVLSSKRVHLRDFAPLGNCASHNFHVDVSALWNPMALLHVELVDGAVRGDEGPAEDAAEVSAESAGEAPASEPLPPPLLSPAQLRRSLIIANTHIYWNPARADIKAVQTAAASRAISFFVKGCGFEPVPFSSSASSASAPSVDAAEAAGAPAVVLCGDFNCLPELPFDPDRGQHMVGAGGEGDEDEEEGEGSGARRAGALGVAEEEGEGAGDWARGPADDAEAALMSIPAPSPTSSTSLPPTPPASSYGSELSAPFVLLHSGALPADHPEHPDRWCAGLRVRDAPSSAGPKFRSLQDGNGPRDASHSPYPNPRLGPLTVDAPLHNVYLMPAFSRAAPLFTTKTDDFQGWIDHIFASAGVQVQKVLLPPITRGDLEAGLKARGHGPMPSKDYPSDHLPVGVVCRLPLALPLPPL